MASGGLTGAFGVATYLRFYRGRIITNDELCRWVYGEDADGGPLDARGTIRATICRLRGEGVPIKTIGQRGYRLP